MSKSPTTSGPYRAQRERTTMALKSTTTRVQSSLDFTSALALEYSQELIHRAGHLRPTVSGIMRRALAVYVAHLQSEGLNMAHEVNAVERISSRGQVAPEQQQEANTRIAAMVQGGPIVGFSEVCSGPDARAQLDAFNDQTEQLVGQMLAQRAARRGAA